MAQQQENDAEAQIDNLPDPNADPSTQSQSIPAPRRSQASGAMVMPSPSLRGAASLSANSYQEAIAASLRKQGFSIERH